MWWQTNYTYVWLFNTGRGLSVLIRLPHGQAIIYDLGSSAEFSPTAFAIKHILPHLNASVGRPIAQCILSHPHADHITEIDAILKTEDKAPIIDAGLITCPNDKEDGQEVDFGRVITDDNKELIAKYRDSYADRTPPLQTMVPPPGAYPADNVEYGIYYLVPPSVDKLHPDDDHAYVNGLSLALYLRHGNQTLLIPGDSTPEAMSDVIDAKTDAVQKRYTYFSKMPLGTIDNVRLENSTQPSLKSLLRQHGLSILVASHHGLESCFSQDLFDVMQGHKTRLNVISDKRHQVEGDGAVCANYQSGEFATGLTVDIDGTAEQRFSISTLSGHHLLMVFKGTNALPIVYLRTTPEDLLDLVP